MNVHKDEYWHNLVLMLNLSRTTELHTTKLGGIIYV